MFLKGFSNIAKFCMAQTGSTHDYDWKAPEYTEFETCFYTRYSATGVLREQKTIYHVINGKGLIFSDAVLFSFATN